MFSFSRPKLVDNYRFLPTIQDTYPTPAFIMDSATVISRFKDITRALSVLGLKSQIAFSFKTNYDFAASALIKKLPLLAETVSAHEYRMAKKLGFTAAKIIINGPHKGSLKSYLTTGSLIHLDNFTEIEEIKAPLSAPRCRLGIRLRPSCVNSHFGFSIGNGDAQKAILALRQRGLKLSSVHIHLGSDIYHPDLYRQAAEEVADFININKIKINTVDFGGGFPAHGATPYGQPDLPTPAILDYLAAISILYKKIPFSPQLILEPGRYLIDDAVSLVTSVLDIKIENQVQIITSDTTISHLPSLWYRPATIRSTTPSSPAVKSIVYGSSCQEHDCLYRGPLPRLQVGSRLIFQAVGAYNQSQASEFIFKKPRFFEI